MPSRPYDSQYAQVLRATATPRDGDREAARRRLLPQLESLPADALADVHLAAALGQADAVRRALSSDPAAASRRGGPFQWEPLTHLAYSVLLDAPEAAGRDFAGAAEALLLAGADPNAGFTDPKAPPGQDFRSVLYAAAAIARHEPLTRVLLAHGADPNDEEVAYHTPEGYDLATLQAVVASGRCSPDTLATMLLRKCDWHDVRGVRWLLEHGADPSRPTRWTPSILHHALDRDDALEIVQSLLDHGADPQREVDGITAVAAAARAGRGDVIDAMARRGVQLRVGGVDALLAACARGHAPAVRVIADTLPAAVGDLHLLAPTVLTRFAGNGNSAGLRLLLDLGLPVDARLPEPLEYHDLAAMGTPLHAAAWRGHPTAVRALLAGGADPEARDARDRTPLQLAVRACVDSHWTDRRTPESVEALLAAGARPAGIALPCGYEPVDALLLSAR